MNPPDDPDAQPPADCPDRTVDFALEILRTPPPEIAGRVRRLSPEMRAAVLAEIIRRYQALEQEAEVSREEIRNLRFHAERLEKLLLEGNRNKT